MSDGEPETVVRAVEVMTARDGLDETTAREDLQRVAEEVGATIEDVASSVILTDD